MEMKQDKKRRARKRKRGKYISEVARAIYIYACETLKHINKMKLSRNEAGSHRPTPRRCRSGYQSRQQKANKGDWKEDSEEAN